MNDLLALSKELKIELVQEDKKSYKILIIGDKDKVKKSSFEKEVLSFMSKIENSVDLIEKDIKEIKTRLDVIESLPTIQKELANKNK